MWAEALAILKWKDRSGHNSRDRWISLPKFIVEERGFLGELN